MRADPEAGSLAHPSGSVEVTGPEPPVTWAEAYPYSAALAATEPDGTEVDWSAEVPGWWLRQQIAAGLIVDGIENLRR